MEDAVGAEGGAVAAWRGTVVEVSGAAAGAVAAWEELYRSRYRSTVYLAGLLVGEFRLGEEIAQEAFARLYEHLARVEDQPSYLRGTVVNLCRSRVRRAVRARRWISDAGHQLEDEGDFADRVAAGAAVTGALERLPARQREAVVLRYFAELSETETAAAMGVSAGSVKTHLHRALNALTVELKELQ